jgi:hypothetical protein
MAGYISAMLDNNLSAVGHFTSTISVFTGSGGTNLPLGTASIVVNDSGAFFSNQFTVDGGQLTGGTMRAQAFVLLHELAHALGAKGFKSDLDNPSNGKDNDKLIDDNCKKTLADFPK